MADVNRGLKNNAYVLGSGIGAVTRFAYQAYLKRVACNIPVSVPAVVPYRYFEGTDATNFVDNWNNPTIFTMEQFGGLGPVTAHGYSTGPVSFTLTLPNLGTHSRIKYMVKWHLVDSLDGASAGEISRMFIGNGSTETEVLTFTKRMDSHPSVSFAAGQLTTSWSGPQQYSYRPWGESGNATVDGYLVIDSGWIAHTSTTLTVRHFMGANQAQSDEAMYLTHVEVLMDSLPLPPPLSMSVFYSKNNVTDGGFTVGYPAQKDMSNNTYTSEFNPIIYPAFFPNMSPFTNGNIVVGDKDEEDRLIASKWQDLGQDIFDDWGFFYLYDVNSGKYYFPLISPQNGADGIFSTQTFNAFGRTFTIVHGWAARGIFKFDISVADALPFKFGGYGNIDEEYRGTHDLTQNYSINGENFTLYYHHYEEDVDFEQLYAYWIPKKASENSTKTYNAYYEDDGGDMGMLSKDVTTGLIVYFAKTYDVKEWVINDIGISS
jgi:hypothetical protein